MNWDDHRYFLAIARARSLTAAGKALGVSQPTVTRRLEAMEARLQVRLFDRTKRGYRLTAAGRAAFARLEEVERELTAVDRGLQGQDCAARGPLTVTCTEILLNGYLAPQVWRFLAAHPEIELELRCSDDQLSLSRREADVALRFTARPGETLIGRRLTKVAFAAYRAEGPRDMEALGEEVPWIGFADAAHNRMLIGEVFPGADIRHRVDSVAAMQAMAAAGLGQTVLPCYIADRDPRLRRAAPAFFRPRIPDLWLLTHADVRGVARIKLFMEAIAAAIEADRDLFEGRRFRNATAQSSPR